MKGDVCITVGGNDPDVSCKFPFYYDTWDDIPYIPTSLLRVFTKSYRKTIKFDKCTDYKHNGKKWCATKVTTGNRYIPGSWGECPDSLSCNGNAVGDKINIYLLFNF